MYESYVKCQKCDKLLKFENVALALKEPLW